MREPAPSDLLPAEIRQAFACLRGEGGGVPPVYLDSASSALKPDAVIDAVAGHYRWLPANIHRGLYPLSEAATAAYEGARTRVQKFLNAGSPQEIVFTSGATEALNQAARSVPPDVQTLRPSSPAKC